MPRRCSRRPNPAITVRLLARDGDRLKRGALALRLEGPTGAILTAERTALNFLQRLSGIATAARRYADAVKATAVRVVDRRKTTPGWRALEKYAVRTGGCFNHRSSLAEQVLIKDNHIAAAGSLTEAVRLCRAAAPHGSKIKVGAKTPAEVRKACEAGADIVLLDNMTPAQVRSALGLRTGLMSTREAAHIADRLISMSRNDTRTCRAVMTSTS